jgi:hypothetical protein
MHARSHEWVDELEQEMKRNQDDPGGGRRRGSTVGVGSVVQ